MESELHNLDLGSPRFLELQLSLVLSQPIHQELFESRAEVLQQRTKFHPIKDNNTTGLWRSTRLFGTLNQNFPLLKTPAANQTIDSSVLHKLIPSDETLHEQIFPRTFKIRAALMKDACLLHFTVQHPLCDASGVHQIVQAYCALLTDREPPPALGDRMPLELYPSKEDDALAAHGTGQEDAALRHERYFTQGWTALGTGVFRQRMQRRKGPVRKEMTLLVPNAVIDDLAKSAERAGISVTKHDLLMGLIHEVIPYFLQVRGER
ncbi:uncharacterized protein KY384_005105 [Bacidia gigantensis]|uniref:uncharacterized protein n=1 Tax=Bacidia gigantensis TaxID=2732470 RepID=UPI001D05318D|nr:uncharacterized protein KY384_005105 [Bacidia gigantensis]KAG8529625.1 hypothetical protein KY384_005105 [Bacidia gigantensis]